MTSRFTLTMAWAGLLHSSASRFFRAPIANIRSSAPSFEDLPKDVDSVDQSSEKTIVKRYKAGQGGDINLAIILGTVAGVKIFPMQSRPERDWAVLFLRTRSLRANVSGQEIDSALSSEDTVSANTENSVPSQRYKSISARVHVFDPRILPSVKRLKLGDRLFVSGFLSYYSRPGTDENKEKPLVNTCAVVARRLLFMGSGPPTDLEVDDDSRTFEDAKF
ncbi:unnamed protein product [Calicophoron daubneyi]|uniref:Uncharacterized protein n=1 Tax=Calicophoron daubneyi TaxID=300641 RepID=A0AAV2TBK9_CALDB